jgi:subfamily B ATP-binding cassette protein MsbA
MGMSDSEKKLSSSRKMKFLLDVARFNPKFTTLITGLGLVAAVLEVVGLSFILPIVEIIQAENQLAEADGLMTAFVTAYQTLGIPLTLGSVVVGVAVVMTA